MKKLAVHLSHSPQHSSIVGTLAEDAGRIFFQYDKTFLGSGLNLSPFRLPFDAGLHQHKDHEFGTLPGLFDDSIPDGWGLLLLDRHLQSIGRGPGSLGPLEKLAWFGTNTMGALTYHPPSNNDTGLPVTTM